MQSAWSKLCTLTNRPLHRKMLSLPRSKNRLVTVARSSRNRSNSWTKKRHMRRMSATPTSPKYPKKRHKSTSSKIVWNKAALPSLTSPKPANDSSNKSPLSAIKWVSNLTLSPQASSSRSGSHTKTSRSKTSSTLDHRIYSSPRVPWSRRSQQQTVCSIPRSKWQIRWRSTTEATGCAASRLPRWRTALGTMTSNTFTWASLGTGWNTGLQSQKQATSDLMGRETFKCFFQTRNSNY